MESTVLPVFGLLFLIVAGLRLLLHEAIPLVDQVKRLVKKIKQ